MFRSDVLSSASIVPDVMDRAVVGRLLREHCSGQLDHSYALWAVWVLARWSMLRDQEVAEPVLAGAAAVIGRT
jgi:hypothetical protein